MTKELQVRNTPPFSTGETLKRERKKIYIYLTKVVLILDFRPPPPVSRHGRLTLDINNRGPLILIRHKTAHCYKEKKPPPPLLADTVD